MSLYIVYHVDISTDENLSPTALPSACCSEPPYLFYPAFGHWPFPHGNPAPWWPFIARGQIRTSARSMSTISTQIKVRDQTCRLPTPRKSWRSPISSPSKSRYSFKTVKWENTATTSLVLPIQPTLSSCARTCMPPTTISNRL